MSSTDSDNPRISYHDLTNGKVRYASWSGSSWNTADVAVVGSEGGYTSLALDNSGYPRISYYNATYVSPNRNLGYAYWDGTKWNNQTVDRTADVGEYSSLALDSSGYPRISYYDATHGALKYASWDGTSWNDQTVDSSGNVGEYTSLALDSSGYPRISYYDVSHGYLKYAAWTGTVWAVSTVDSSGNVGEYTSLALDSSGYPRISYYDVSHGYLKYAAWTGTTWAVSTVDSTGDVGEYSSLKLTQTGSPKIGYHDATNHDLKYAYEITAPAAGFTATPLSGTAPLTVQFTDSSTNTPASWSWDFGDGQTSITQNPSHQYTSAGTYTVTLTATNAGGSSTSTTSVSVSPAPATPPASGGMSGSDSGPPSSAGRTSVQAVPVEPAASTESVNAGGNSAISSVTVTGVGVADLIVTAMQVPSPPQGVPAPDAPVYQYIEVTPARYTSISSASISFEVPPQWIEEQHATLSSVALNRYHENSWTTLPTHFDRTANGWAYYTAESPGFSIFAIVSIKGSAIGAEAVQIAAQSSAEPSPDVQSLAANRTIVPTPSVPAATVNETVPHQGEGQSGFAGVPFTMIAVIGIPAVICIVALALFRNNHSGRRREKW